MKKILTLPRHLLSLFYPHLCIGCQNILQANELHLCLDCLLHLPETGYHLCRSNPLEEIFAGRVPVEQIWCFLHYKKGSRVQHLLHALKYKGNKEVGSYLAELYTRKLLQTDCLKEIDLILPIPLHPKKQRLRGYNQSEWIAKGISQISHIPYSTQHLLRTTFTETQTRKKRFSRWRNVKDVFQIEHEEELRHKHILVCDDVLTTGATTEAAIRKILEVEGTRVSVLTLAVAQH